MLKFFIFLSILLWPKIAFSYLGPGLGIGSIVMVFTVIITFILVLLGEITPKVYAKQHAVKFSKRMV